MKSIEIHLRPSFFPIPTISPLHHRLAAAICMLQSSCHWAVHFGDRWPPDLPQKEWGPRTGMVKPADPQPEYTQNKCFRREPQLSTSGPASPTQKMPFFKAFSCQHSPAMIEEVRTRQVPIGTPPAMMPHHRSLNCKDPSASAA